MSEHCSDNDRRFHSFDRLRRIFSLLALLTLLPACHKSGTWQNDSGNWKRVFGKETPNGITVVNSWYWRSPHFTYEFEYFFALAPHDTFQKQAVESGKLIKFTPNNKEERDKAQRFFNDKPPWFLSKPIENYEIWKGKAPQENFRLYIDRQTGDLFLTDHSI